jgi:hypothetical protein
MNLKNLLAGYPLLGAKDGLPRRIEGFSADSKLVKPGFL